MARYTGPKSRISRRYGVALFGPSKALERKNYPPGMHGPKGSRRKRSDYSAALAEKQKLRFQYGLMERQFRRYFESALRKRGVTGETLLQCWRHDLIMCLPARLRKFSKCCATNGVAWARDR